MPVPVFTLPPTPPTRGEPATFSARFAAFLAWIVAAWNQLVTAVGWMNTTAEDVAADAAAVAADRIIAQNAQLVVLQANGMLRRISDNLTVGAGAKNLTGLNVPGNAAFFDGMEVALVSVADGEVLQWGVTSLTNAGAGTMRVTVAAGDFAGAGPVADWFVIPRWLVGLLPATAAEVLAAQTATKGFTPKAMRQALTRQVLVDGATVTPDTMVGLDFIWTLGGNRALAAIVNTYPGARGRITMKMDATGGRILAWASGVYKRRGGLPVLPTAPGAEAHLNYDVVSIDGGGVATEILTEIIKAPTS